MKLSHHFLPAYFFLLFILDFFQERERTRYLRIEFSHHVSFLFSCFLYMYFGT
ncbi:MAG: hypothetical protein EXX96DRAFT_551733 [Benjaminiella poitrasii]|nr:MAG: hypothetical protein EXX96DRAFT_551733 [Benjaminiella poitrasii]